MARKSAVSTQRRAVCLRLRQLGLARYRQFCKGIMRLNGVRINFPKQGRISRDFTLGIA